MRNFFSIFLIVLAFFPCAAAGSDDLLECAGKADNVERLECYDAVSTANVQGIKVDSEQKKIKETRSYLTRSWDLDNMDDKLLGVHQTPLKPHHVSYLIVRKTSEANQYPYSPLHGSVTLPVQLDLTEIKFQISQKAKVFNPVRMNFLGIESFRLWGAYTQQSSWQAFNTGNSSPFRETIYEPELILTLSTGNQYGLKLVNIGYIHQSNGRNTTLSRSWNRTYIQGGWESDTFSGLVRGWWRIPEASDQDDNSDIEEYLGRAEATLRWAPLDGSQTIGLTIRNNLRSDQNRGFVQLDWATPINLNQSAKLHVQLTSGYGETLIDYNFRQTTLGLGVSFRDW